MKKLLSIATILILAFSLCCVSCTQDPEQTTTDNMTDSYRAARKSVHDSSGIWLPELEGIEITNTEITPNGAKPLVNISFAGDEALFNQLATYLNEKIGNNPDMSEANLKWWEMQYTDKGQAYVGNISIFFNKDSITIASHFFRGFTVTLTASPAAGGTVSFKLAGTPVAGPSLTEAENSDMDLVATPATGYEFAGWYRNNTLVSDKANYTDFKVPGENVTIEARFSEKQTQMTESYSAARAEFKTVTALELPEIDNLEVDREYPYKEGDTGYCFDIIGGSALTYESYLALETFLTGKIGNPDEGYPTGDEATGRASRWTTATRWYTLDWYKLDNESFMIFLNTDAIKE